MKQEKGAYMGYPTRIQVIKRKLSEQFYVNFPSALAHAVEFQKGEIVEWVFEDKTTLILKRKKKRLALEPKQRATKKCILP